jgi:hypothetical protein
LETPKQPLTVKEHEIHLTPRILQTIEGDTIAGVRGEMNALVESLVSQDFMEEAEVNKRESVMGYIKDPQKLAAVVRKEIKTGWTGFHTGWTGFHQKDSGSLTYSAGDSTRSKTGWAGKNSGWTGFPKRSATTFLTALIVRQVRAGMTEEQSQNRLNRFQARLNRFTGLKTTFEYFEETKGGVLVWSKNGFSQGHLWSRKMFSKMISKDFELSSLHNLLNYCGSLLIARRFL